LIFGNAAEPDTPREKPSPEAAMKNIVLCCDGTANEFKRNRTNVVKLYYALEHSGSQAAYYHPGLGTMEAVGALTSPARLATKLLGQAFGYGLEADIRDAYVYLMRTFEPDDRVFLFGFSRGAYTVRAVASLLHMYGLIAPGNEPLVPYAIRMMVADSRDGTAEGLDLAVQFADTFSSRACQPHFVGVWDTVSSVGWVENPLHLRFSASNPDIAIGRHAVAIDERRAFFRQNLWRPQDANGGPKDVKQVWFAGVHCDVGGGYPEDESGLSKIALEWMLAEAHAAGLQLSKTRTDEVLGRTSRRYAQPDADAALHNSMDGLWPLAEFVWKRHYDAQTGKTGRRMNLFRRRTVPDGALIHESVFARKRDAYAPSLPANRTVVGTLPLP
jgi:uncharacterized protein (DUF2235 family)